MSKETPLFDELYEQFQDVQKLAYKRGYLKAQLELLDHINTELKAKRLPPSKGVKAIIEQLNKPLHHDELA